MRCATTMGRRSRVIVTSVYVTKRALRPAEHLGSAGDRANFRAGSWFRRLVPVEPGRFVLPGPEDPKAYDPTPPPTKVKGEVLDPRRYLGRVQEVHGKTLALTVWEVPNAREIFASVALDAPGLSSSGKFRAGTPVEFWTWTELKSGARVERLHIVALATARSPARRRA